MRIRCVVHPPPPDPLPGKRERRNHLVSAPSKPLVGAAHPISSPLPLAGDTGIQPQLRGLVVRVGSGVGGTPRAPGRAHFGLLR